MHRRHLLRGGLGLLTLGVTVAATSPALAAGGSKKAAGAPSFTQFPMLTVFTAGRNARHGSLSVEVGVHAADPKMAEPIQLYTPRLKDAYVTALQAYASTLSSRSVVNTDYITAQLQAATDRVLGKPGAKVLLGSVILN